MESPRDPIPFRLLARSIVLGLVVVVMGCGQTAEPVAGGAVIAADEPATDQSAGATTRPSGQDEDPENPEDRAATDEEPIQAENPFPRRLKAPSLEGGVGWINTAGPIDLADLRGKFVVLDFWTYCCINCIHVLPELKKLERAYPNEIVVIGVHSAKFETEEDSQNIQDAVLRYEIEHPVINDAEHAVWDKFEAASWPTLRIIDPEGYLVAGHSGEVTFDVLGQFFESVLPYYRDRGLVDESPIHFDLAAYQTTRTPLRYPGKIVADEQGGRLFIADSNHNRIVVATLDGALVEAIGGGAIGAADGDFKSATFNHPQGMFLQSTPAGELLYVADTENHLLRVADLSAKTVATIAGTGLQAESPWPGIETIDPLDPVLPERWVGPPRETALNSPWDLWIHEDQLYIAMAGPHQIWRMPLEGREIGPFAGNGREDIVDGPLLPRQPFSLGYASFAQPSGLASDGLRLFVADSEGSSIRSLPFDADGEVATLVGTSHLPDARLFTFGDVDGRAPNALLQHALGVVWHDGLIYVADTYNNKIKVLDPDQRSIQTLAGTGEQGAADDAATFDEPAGIAYAAGKLYVADTNNHLIRTIDLAEGNKVSTLQIGGLKPPDASSLPVAGSRRPGHGGGEIAVPQADLKPSAGKVSLKIKLTLPQGFKLNRLAPMSYSVERTGETGAIADSSLTGRAKLESPSQEIEIPLGVNAAEGEDHLKVTLDYYYCREGAEGVCKVGAATWSIPLRLAKDAATSALELKVTAD